jgi:uncharacterized protein
MQFAWYMPTMQVMIEAILRATGTYWWGRANARKVQLRHNEGTLPRLPKAFDGFTILHLSDLHADMSACALKRVAELVLGLEQDICVMTGDYRGRTYGDYKPCLEGVAHLREVLHANFMRCWEITTPSPWFQSWKRSSFACCSTKASRSSATRLLFASRGVDDAHFYHADDIEKRRRTFRKAA